MNFPDFFRDSITINSLIVVYIPLSFFLESQLVDLISSEELEVHREEDVFNAVIKWAECKSDTW